MRWVALCALISCGNFHFVDGFAEQKAAATAVNVQVIASQNEKVSALFWKQAKALPASIGHYEVGINGVYVDAAIVAQPAVSTDKALAFAVIAPAPVTFALRMRVKEGVRDMVVPKTLTRNLAVSASFSIDDRVVHVTTIDPFAQLIGGGLERVFAPEVRDASCSTVLTRASNKGAFTDVPGPTPLSDDGNYCVTLTSNAAHLSVPVQTVPLVTEIPYTYAIPTIGSNSIVVPVWDFDEPDPGTCAGLLSELQGVVENAVASSGTSVAPINVATSDTSQCQHPASPSFSLDAVQDRVGPLITVSGAMPAVLFVLVSNVDAPITSSLETSLQTAVQWVQAQTAIADVAILGTNNLTGTYFGPVRTAAWTYASDPALPATLSTLITQVVPYQSYDLEPDTTLSFFATPPPPNAFGFKVCGSNLPLSIDDDIGAPYFPLPQTPGTFHTQAMQPFAPVYAFSPGVVSASIEVCSRYCDRASGWYETSSCEGAR